MQLPYLEPLSQEKRSRLALSLTLFAILAYFVLFTIITVGRHRAIETHTLDLVNMDQAVWNTINGRLLEMSPVPGIDTRLARHFEPILLPISLLYLLYNSAETLLIVQTAVIALGGLPIYWLARDRFQNEWMGVLFTSLYLLYPTVQGVNNFDFHPVALSITFLLFTYHAVETDQRWRAIFFAVLAMSGKENIPLVIAMLGVFILLLRRDKKLGLFFVTIGATWFIVSFQVIIPAFVPDGISAYVGRYATWGSSQGEIVMSFLTRPFDVLTYLTQPIKLHYYWDLLFPLAFLALFAPHWLLVSAPIFAINLLSSTTGQSIADKNHYVSGIIPSVMIAAIYGGSWLTHFIATRTRLDRYGLMALIALLSTSAMLYQHYYRGYSPLAYTFSWPLPDQHDAIGREIMAQIPADAAVSAQSDLGPQLSHRQELFLFPRPHEAEYVMLDVMSGLFPVRHYADYVTAVDNTLNNGYGIIDSRDGYILMQRGVVNRDFAPEFYSFAIPEQPIIPQMPLTASINNELTLLGYDFQPGRDTGIHIITYWRTENPITTPYQIYLNMTTEDGRTIISREPRTTFWLPPDAWPADTVIAVDFGSIGLRGADFEQIDLSLHVQTGAEDEVLPFDVTESMLAPPLKADGREVVLGTFCYEYGILRPCHQMRQYKLPAHLQNTYLNFDNNQALVGIEIAANTIQAGQPLEFTLYWQNLAVRDTDYTIFTHLTAGDEWILVGQDDQMPGEGAYPTSWWASGEIVADQYRIALNPDTPPGQYVLRVGVYDAATGARLSLLDTAGNPVSDHARLMEITVLAAD